ncbi:MAG TPA: nitrilase-related carbon-nitrogen hydrolase [Vicinamibacterales bacterium]|nr:nitrilase-related carbon-nitrogen hydrolase [Vicinamibacterales bacterium]
MAQFTSLLYLAAGAGLLGLVPRIAAPPATWLALTLLLHASRAMPAWPGQAYVWIVLYVSAAIAYRGVLPAPDPIYFAICAFITTSVALPFVADRLLASRFGAFGSTLIFALAFVAVEFLRSRFAPPATWGSIAYTQFGVAPLMQIAAVVGIWGITFLVAWFAGTAELAWSRAFDWSVIRTPVLAFASVLALVVLGGSVRLALAPTDGSSMRTATLNRPVDLFINGEMTRITEGRVTADEYPQLAAKTTRLQDWFLDGSRREARAGARLIVFPEGNLLVFATDEAAFLERAAQVARDERVYLAIGMGTILLGEKLPFENKLVLIDPAGRTLVSYRKTHPANDWEAGIMRAGDGRVPIVDTPDGRLAGAICFDADFPEFIRQAAQGSADLLIVPVNDWLDIKDLHYRMHAFRAIETGMPVVRAAASGISSAFDPWGRVLGVSDFFAPGDRTLTVQVPVGHVNTIYAKTGDLFAWLCVACVVLAIGVTTLK